MSILGLKFTNKRLSFWIRKFVYFLPELTENREKGDWPAEYCRRWNIFFFNNTTWWYERTCIIEEKMQSNKWKNESRFFLSKYRSNGPYVNHIYNKILILNAIKKFKVWLQHKCRVFEKERQSPLSKHMILPILIGIPIFDS